MKRAVAVIPAKSSSSRVPRKNFKVFYNDFSLLHVKIKQCLESGCFDSVYVSSDSDEAKEIAESLGAVFIRREHRLCIDETPWSEVLVGVLNQIPVGDDVFVAWSPITSPLFSRYKEAMDIVGGESGHDSVMTVTKLQHYFLNADHIPLNFQFGVWASYSQKLKPIYQMNCALWLARKGAMIRNRFQTGDVPYYMETSMVEGVDIDTPDEFELAQLLYEREMERG